MMPTPWKREPADGTSYTYWSRGRLGEVIETKLRFRTVALYLLADPRTRA